MQEIIIDNSVTNYDECYLRAMELATDYVKNEENLNPEYWLYQEIKGAVEYYHKKSNALVKCNVTWVDVIKQIVKEV